MDERRVGRSGLVVSSLGLGTMTWGQDTDAEDAAAQLAAFRDAGGTFVDTADVYAGGAGEEVLGSLLSGGVPREQLVIATKAYGRTHPGAMGAGSSRGHLLVALDASLRRLQTEYVDLWQLHAFDAETPMEETLAALDTAVSSGRARYVGVSNFCGWQLAAAACWQRAWPARAPIVSDQVEYSLLERGAEREVAAAATYAGIGLLAWSPLGRGVLSGKYRHGAPSDSRGASSRFSGFVEPYLDEEAGRIVEAVLTAAEGLGTSAVAVALAWLRDRPGIATAIVGARTVGQLAASLASTDVELPGEIRAALDDVSAPYAGYPEKR